MSKSVNQLESFANLTSAVIDQGKKDGVPLKDMPEWVGVGNAILNEFEEDRPKLKECIPMEVIARIHKDIF